MCDFAAWWQWLHDHDLPHWVAVAFSLVVWPLVLWWWHNRRIHNVPGLEVTLGKGNIAIHGTPHAAIDLNFINHTGAVVYITKPRIRGCTTEFPVTEDSARDIGGGYHHLKFLTKEPGAIGLLDREITLQTVEDRRTAIAIEKDLPADFLRYRTPAWRRWLRRPRFFILEYTAVVGSDRYLVATTY